jgi:hypothetical protein
MAGRQMPMIALFISAMDNSPGAAPGQRAMDTADCIEGLP